MKIKFSHNYPKLHDQKAAHLLYIEIRDRSSLPDDFVAWDTLYAFHPEAHYQLPSGPLMILVFLGNNLFPFTTVRRWTEEKERYYRGGIGKRFDIEVETRHIHQPGQLAMPGICPDCERYLLLCCRPGVLECGDFKPAQHQ